MTTNPVEIPIDEAIANFDDYVFLDGSWWLGPRETANRQDFETGPRIKGSHFFDIDDIASKGPELNPQNLPHMMPPPALFAAYMDACGIANEQPVIVYGQAGCPYIHRSWLQMRTMGHDKTKVLQGSLQDWIDRGGPIEEGPATILRAENLDLSKQPTYQAKPAINVVDKAEVLHAIQSASNDDVIVDARSADRFYARAPEPRPGLRGGHMPGAKNVFFMDVLSPDNPLVLRPKDELVQLFQNVDGTRIIASCGSGATACTLIAGMMASGKDPSQLYLYDGSWSEWGADDDVPIEEK